MGTHTTTDSRQVALGTDDADGIAQIALLQFMYPVGNVVADGTSLLTLGDAQCRQRWASAIASAIV